MSIHPLCYIDAAGGISLGDNISVAHGTTVMSTSHVFDELNTPINDQGVSTASTYIGDDCWIGAQCVIVAGVKIGPGSVVGANSVVTRDVPSGSVVAGSPASIVRKRGGPND
ncbi:acyltransferase [Rhodococcus sp. X156]|uniref:acyltransferase n=1 Tax=Rhodococcus sp. X156 TaxID=2499145 RepID=UPI0013E39004|nr:acyltransferase [Rhodococcus sp. X156]